jgi:hypothetical protein
MAPEEKPPPTGRVDMSPEAIDQRLRDLGQLYKFGMSLRDIKPLGEAVDCERRAEGDPSSRANFSGPRRR